MGDNTCGSWKAVGYKMHGSITMITTACIMSITLSVHVAQKTTKAIVYQANYFNLDIHYKAQAPLNFKNDLKQITPEIFQLLTLWTHLLCSHQPHCHLLCDHLQKWCPSV